MWAYFFQEVVHASLHPHFEKNNILYFCSKSSNFLKVDVLLMARKHDKNAPAQEGMNTSGTLSTTALSPPTGGAFGNLFPGRGGLP
jgi:hypothetical protein